MLTFITKILYVLKDNIFVWRKYNNMKYNIKFCVFAMMVLMFSSISVGAFTFTSGEQFYTMGVKNIALGHAGCVYVAKNAVKRSSEILQSISKKVFFNPRGDPTVTLLDELDQSQTSSNKNYKIYGGFWAAQSFKPSKEKITRVYILVNRTEKKSFSLPSMVGNKKHVGVTSLGGLKSLKNKGVSSQKKHVTSDLGEITVSIRASLSGSDLTSKSLSPDEVPKNTNAGWVEFDLPDYTVSSGHTYYIVVHADGGDEKHYYNWRYIDYNRYSDGNAYVSNDGGSSWDVQSWDFAFKTYGGLVGEEPDGNVERWAVIVGISDYEGSENDVPYCDSDALDMKNVLISHGWKSDHIKILLNSEATGSNIRSAIRWMDSKEDEDDIVLFFFSGHGFYGNSIAVYPWNLFYMSRLDENMDKLGSKNMVLIFNSCFSGGFQNYLAQPGRVILMSSKSNEYSYMSLQLKNGIFTYFLLEGFAGSADSNHDGWVSAEEAFDYAAPKTTERAIKPQHPQIYDGCPGEVPITKV